MARGGVRIKTAACISREALGIAVPGSGAVTLPAGLSFKSLDVRVSGVSNVSLGNADVENMTVSVSGMGVVEDFSVIRKGNFSMSGMATIHGTSAPGCLVRKSMTGMGSIRIAEI